MDKHDMRPYQLKKITNFCLNMAFAFFVIALAFGVVWVFYFICELQKYY